MNPGMSKLFSSSNGPLCAYLVRQNLHDRTRSRSLYNEYLWNNWKWPEKALTIILNALRCKTRKKFAKLWLRLNPEVIVSNMLSRTFVPNFMDLTCKMSPGMPKLFRLLNGPLGAYLMKQNLHNWIRPRSEHNKCSRHVWKHVTTHTHPQPPTPTLARPTSKVFRLW